MSPPPETERTHWEYWPSIRNVSNSTESMEPGQIDGTAAAAADGDDSDSDRSRPPTPFSRPLTARNVAQRPRTTTIFERESDAKRARSANQRSSGGLGGNPGCVRCPC